MNGLLLKLIEGKPGSQAPWIAGRWFWKLFRPIQQDLDRLFWYMLDQPWMGAPFEFYQDPNLTEPFDAPWGGGQLWRPGTLGRFADQFGEEFIQLFGIEPTSDDPKEIASLYAKTPLKETETFVIKHARIWLLYTDGTCWEIYARKSRLIDLIRESLLGKPWVEVFESLAENRKVAFRNAGLEHVWSNSYGYREKE